jgi:hypothetical protein
MYRALTVIIEPVDELKQYEQQEYDSYHILYQQMLYLLASNEACTLFTQRSSHH